VDSLVAREVFRSRSAAIQKAVAEKLARMDRGRLERRLSMARILRGDVVWAELDPIRGHEQSGRHPVLVLSQDVFNERSGTVIACALTSQEPRAGFR
jgi:Arc/MetJ-type ribon-helix-helix transcriptional regulator